MPQCTTCSIETMHTEPVLRRPMCIVCILHMEDAMKVYEKGKKRRDRDRAQKKHTHKAAYHPKKKSLTIWDRLMGPDTV